MQVGLVSPDKTTSIGKPGGEGRRERRGEGRRERRGEWRRTLKHQVSRQS